MPIYLLGCDRCGEKTEVIQGMDKENPPCPGCGAKMKKLPTYPAKIDIKGTYRKGYKEDYAKDYRRRLQELQEAKT